MNDLIIEKKSMKFTVEVDVTDNDVIINVVRHIQVNKHECMSSNAELARYDAMHVGQKFVNCHDMIHNVIGSIKNTLPDNTPVKSKIILKKRKVFGGLR